MKLLPKLHCHSWAVLLLLCGACHSTDQTLEKALTVCLDNNNQFVKNQSIRLLAEMEKKDADVRTHSRAELWKPRVMAIHKMSQQLCGTIDSIKTHPNMQTRQMLSMVLEKVEHFRQAIPDILLNDSFPSPNVQADFEKYVKKMLIEFPFAATARMDSGSTTISGVVWNKIENDVLPSEYYLISYIYKHVDVDEIFTFTIFEPLIHQNYSQLKKGQQLVITAGIGAYSSATKKVFIDGKAYESNAKGYVQYRTTANGSSGKHSIPMKIEYKLPDGTTKVFNKSLEYTILP